MEILITSMLVLIVSIYILSRYVVKKENRRTQDLEGDILYPCPRIYD